MAYFDYFELHKNCKRKYLAKGKNYITFNEEWSIKNADLVPSFAIEDFKTCLNKSFDIELGEDTQKIIEFKLVEGLNHSYKIYVTENTVTFIASEKNALVQAIFYAEDLMKLYGDASLEIKEHEIKPLTWPRLITSSLDGGTYTKEYLNTVLHYGYNGIILYSDDDFTFELAKTMGLLTYYCGENAKNYSEKYDGVIIEEIPCDFNEKYVYSSLYWNVSQEEKLEILKKLPSNSTVIISFDEGQVLEKDSMYFTTKSGAIAMNQPSDYFVKALNFLQQNNINVIASFCGGGTTNEMATMPYIPAMMQWFMRVQALKELNISATIESERYGFVPNLVAEFIKSQLLYPCDEGGIAIQKIASKHFGAENVEKVMMAFKKITDGANWFVVNDADLIGPMQFGPAFPLVNGNLYEYDFSRFDGALESDINMKACDGFNKASLILSHIENDEAQELSVILNFLVNTLVTSANAKRWYRRIEAIKETDADYKKQFLYGQLVKIGEQEIKNAYETAELLIKAPYLSSNNYDELCTPNALEAKIKLTENAVNEFKKKLNYQ